MALVLTQSLTTTSTRNICGDNDDQPVHKAHNLTVISEPIFYEISHKHMELHVLFLGKFVLGLI
jgi:hypothetical protein